jgi:long-chain fatty acid transport protein
MLGAVAVHRRLCDDRSAVNDANCSVALPVGQSYRYGIGAVYKVSQTVDLGAAYELARAGNLPVNQSTDYRDAVSGIYNNAFFSFFSLNLNWRF